MPYFRYLLDSCVSHLTSSGGTGAPKLKKRRTAGKEGVHLSEAGWHLRYLVLSALHKCYLYDSGAFLDASRFQVRASTCIEVGCRKPLRFRMYYSNDTPPK